MNANHKHTAETSRELFGNTLFECACGARKWSHGKAIEGATIDSDGWYVKTEKTAEEITRHNYDLLQTEGYGYGRDAYDPLDSHHPDFID